MKHTVYGIALAFVAILIIAAVMAVSGKDIRENEMDKALNVAVEQSLRKLKEEGGYDAADWRELAADFNQALLLHISSDSDVKVEILTADLDRGALDVKITETYKTTGGKKKQSSCRKTVILEEYADKRPYHTVTFNANGKVHARYSLYEGSIIMPPQEPEAAGHAFSHWVKSGSGENLTPEMKADQDMEFVAVFD